MSEQKPIKFFDSTFAVIVIVFLVLITVICFFPYWFTRYQVDDVVDFRNTGQIGDTIGGLMSPFIAIVASILTFLAFWAQIKANREQVRQFSEQKTQFNNQLEEQKRQFNEDLKKRSESENLQRFETKYFELVRFHRANMEEMNVDDKVYARKCFTSMYDEFRWCYKICEEYYPLLNQKTRDGIPNLTGFAYTIFFYGIGDISEKQYQFNNFELRLFQAVKHKFEEIQVLYTTMFRASKATHNNIQFMLGKGIQYYDAFYFPFDGHISRLAHYYRHLFHTVKFVVKQSESLVPYEQKLDYLQTLRAQLSNHEQVMLYYNAVAGFGEAWFRNDYFTTYKMIHNLPFDIADFGLKPHDHPKLKEGIALWQKKGSELFEQDEPL